MPGPPAPVAAVRRAVRGCLADLDPGDLVLVAVSGGADSRALLAAAVVEGRAAGVGVGAVVVDHQMQPGSAEVTQRVAEQCRDLGAEPTVRIVVEVEGTHVGIEADARRHRYAALDAVADEHAASVVLLGHTLDDQAEQVILGLVRGSGARSLSGMPRGRGRYRRPLLGVSRATTRAACEAEGHTWWDDPMNADPAFTRVRVRRALADLERDVGPGLTAALARTADQLRADADHLDALAELEVLALGDGPWAVEAVAGLPDAVRGRVWRRLLIAAGAPAGQLAKTHVDTCDALLTAWRGQGPVHVPGGLRVGRADGFVRVTHVGRGPDRGGEVV